MNSTERAALKPFFEIRPRRETKHIAQE